MSAPHQMCPACWAKVRGPGDEAVFHTTVPEIHSATCCFCGHGTSRVTIYRPPAYGPEPKFCRVFHAPVVAPAWRLVAARPDTDRAACWYCGNATFDHGGHCSACGVRDPADAARSA